MFGKSERFEDYAHGPVAMAVGMGFALTAGAKKELPVSARCCIVLARSGAIDVSACDAVWVCASGTAVLVGAQTQAVISCVSDCVVHVVLLGAAHGRAWPRLRVRRIAVTDLVRALVGELVQASTNAVTQRLRRLSRVLADEIRFEDIPSIGLPRPKDPRLARACAAVRADPAARWDAQALAARAGMSTRTLARQFVQEVGVSPARWCRAVRLTAALTEVARGGTLHQAAAASGFAGPASLCAAFKQGTGTTLRRYFRAQTSPEGREESDLFD